VIKIILTINRNDLVLWCKMS